MSIASTSGNAHTRAELLRGNLEGKLLALRVIGWMVGAGIVMAVSQVLGVVLPSAQSRLGPDAELATESIPSWLFNAWIFGGLSGGLIGCAALLVRAGVAALTRSWKAQSLVQIPVVALGVAGTIIVFIQPTEIVKSLPLMIAYALSCLAILTVQFKRNAAIGDTIPSPVIRARN